MVKKIIITLMVFVASLICEPQAYAQTSSSSQQTSSSTIKVVLHRPYLSKYPRIPSNQQIYFSYNVDTQECSLSYDTDEYENAVVWLTNDSTGFMYVLNFSSDELCIHEEIPSGSYQITCVLDDETIYEGLVTI